MDDGSTDDSWDILTEYANQDKRFRVFKQDNSGVSSARNTLLEYVQGCFFTFIDSDDVVSSEYLKIAYNLIKGGRYDGLSMQNYSIFHERHEIQDMGHIEACKVIIHELAALEALENKPSNPSVPGNVCCKFYSTAKYGNCRFAKDLFMCEDVAFLGLALSMGGTWCIVDGISLYWYRQHKSSACASKGGFRKTYNALLAVYYVLTYMKKAFPDTNKPFLRYWEIHRKSIEPYYIQSLSVYKSWSLEEKMQFQHLLSDFKKVLGRKLPLYFRTRIFITPPFAYFDRTLCLLYNIWGKIRKIFHNI